MMGVRRVFDKPKETILVEMDFKGVELKAPMLWISGEKPMESWRRVWRDGVAPLVSTEGLEALREGLEEDDPRLIQGATTSPPPLVCTADWPIEAADSIAYAFWIGDGLRTVGEVEEAFARVAYEVDQRLGEPAGCRYYLNWFDETPRDEMRRELLEEVNLALEKRRVLA